jgi:hypothetical protein
MGNTEKEVRTSISHKTLSHKRCSKCPPSAFCFTTESQVCDEHYVVNRVLAKFVLITNTIDVTCKQAMTLVAWKQENVNKKKTLAVNQR